MLVALGILGTADDYLNITGVGKKRGLDVLPKISSLLFIQRVWRSLVFFKLGYHGSMSRSLAFWMPASGTSPFCLHHHCDGKRGEMLRTGSTVLPADFCSSHSEVSDCLRI